MRTVSAKLMAIVGLGLLTAACSSADDASSALMRTQRGGRTVIGGVALSSNLNAAIGLPTSGNDAEVLISRHQYVISWNEQTRNLNWSAWELDPSFLGRVQRTNKFIADPDLTTYLSDKGGEAPVKTTDYVHSCFDRGHQTPSGDRTDSKTDNAITFVMSNVIPQTAYLNRVIWEHFEAHTRSLVKAGSHFYLFAGPIYDRSSAKIGPNHDIEVPSADFKILVDGSGDQAQVVAAIIMPNLTSKGTDPTTDHAQACADQHGIGAPPNNPPNDWQKYLTTVDEIEKETGFDFGFLQ